jgi:hypothetical protein
MRALYILLALAYRLHAIAQQVDHCTYNMFVVSVDT